MRLWHLVVVILAVGILLAISRDVVGRIALIVFVTALGEVVVGTTAVIALFQTVGPSAWPGGCSRHGQALAATHLRVDRRHGRDVDLAVHRRLAGPGRFTMSRSRLLADLHYGSGLCLVSDDAQETWVPCSRLREHVPLGLAGRCTACSRRREHGTRSGLGMKSSTTSSCVIVWWR